MPVNTYVVHLSSKAEPGWQGDYDDYEIVIGFSQWSTGALAGTPANIIAWAEKVIEIAKAHMPEEVTE